MNIAHDMSYLKPIDKMAIEENMAELKIEHIWVGYEAIGEEQITKEEAQKKITALMEELSKHYKIYQYNTKANDYDIFFWCNCGDMSYIQLSTKGGQTMTALKWFIDCYNGYGLKARYQYEAVYDDQKLKEYADNYFETIKNSFIELDRGIFKVKKTNGDNYRFFLLQKRKHKYGKYANDKNMYSFSKGIYGYSLFE